MNRGEQPPLLRRDLPEPDRVLPVVAADRRLPDPGVVDQDVDRAEPLARRRDDFVDGVVARQIGLDRQQRRLLALLAGAPGERGQPFGGPVRGRDPDPGVKQPAHQRAADAARRSGNDRRALSVAHRVSPDIAASKKSVTSRGRLQVPA